MGAFLPERSVCAPRCDCSGAVLGAGLGTTFNITVGSRTTNSAILVSLRADGNNVVGEFSETNNVAVVSVQPRVRMVAVIITSRGKGGREGLVTGV